MLELAQLHEHIIHNKYDKCVLQILCFNWMLVSSLCELLLHVVVCSLHCCNWFPRWDSCNSALVMMAKAMNISDILMMYIIYWFKHKLFSVSVTNKFALLTSQPLWTWKCLSERWLLTCKFKKNLIKHVYGPVFCLFLPVSQSHFHFHYMLLVLVETLCSPSDWSITCSYELESKVDICQPQQL